VDGQYWYKSLCHPVLFAEAIAEAVRRTDTQPSTSGAGSEGEREGEEKVGVKKENEWVFRKLDPRPVVCVFINDTVALMNKRCIVMSTLIMEDFKERETILRFFTRIYKGTMDWNFFPSCVSHSFPISSIFVS
jgi:acyl transferase domain-containing protein